MVNQFLWTCWTLEVKMTATIIDDDDDDDKHSNTWLDTIFAWEKKTLYHYFNVDSFFFRRFTH